MSEHPGKRILASIVIMAAVLLPSLRAHAIGKEFITSATYGVIAGTIVGAATLAFTQNPGDKLNRIARGASIGLYAGILLGFYVTYGVGGEVDEEEYLGRRQPETPKLALVPLFDEKGFDGAAAVWEVHRF